MGITIARESPLTADLELLFARHHAHCHSDTPPESIHMMDRSELETPDIAFYVLRRDGTPLGMGAVKRFGDNEGEIKSMHVLAEAQGAGLARRLVVHMIDAARAEGLQNLSLETGAQDSFAPARALYRAAGFHECPPFGSYQPDPMSVFMTRSLDQG